MILCVVRVGVRRGVRHGVRSFRKNSDFIDIGNFEVGIWFRDCRGDEIGLFANRDESPLCWGLRTFRDTTTSVHAILGHFQFGT